MTIFTGSSGNDLIIASELSDLLDGLEGDDTLQGAAGDDSLIGGAGLDTALFSGNVADYAVATVGTQWTFTDLVGGDGGDTLDGVEQAQFADRLIYLDGRNNAPVLDGALIATTNEDAAPTVIDLLAGVWDFDESDTLSSINLTQTAGPSATASLANNALIIDPGQFNYLGAGQSATLTYAYEVSDGDVALARTLTVTVEGRNDAPTLVAPDIATAYGGRPLTVTGIAIDDIDAQGALTLELSAAHGVLTLSDVSGLTFINATGNGQNLITVQGALADLQNALSSLIYLPDADYVGADALSAIITDDGGAEAFQAADEIAITVKHGEKHVNSHIGGSHIDPKIAALADGGHVVVWSSSEQDGSSAGVYGQRFNTAGLKVGGEFQLNTYTVSQQDDPQVAALNNGGFVAVWQSAGQDGSYLGVVGRRFAADGTPVSGEFLITANTYDNQWHPKVAALANGGFVVAYAVGGGASSNISYRFQRYDASGVAAGAEARISGDVSLSGFPTYESISCDVIGLADGTFLTTWTATDGDSAGLSVRAQRWSAAGAYMGPTMLVNQVTSSHQQKVAAASLSDGGYVLTWESNGQDGAGQGIYARRYNAAGIPVDNEFLVNAYTAGNQSDVAVTGLHDGGFFITWHSDNGAGTGTDIYGQRYNAAGGKVGEETLINLETLNNQTSASVAVREDGGIVAAWVSSNVYQNGGHEIISRIIAETSEAAPATPPPQQSPLLGADIQANTHIGGSHAEPDVAALADGGHVVVWSSGVQDGSALGVYAQRFDASGVKVGGEFQLNIYAANQQDDPQVAALNDGGFVAVWQSAGQDGSYLGVVGRRFAADGTPVGNEFLATANTYDNQWHPKVAALANGGFVVAYAVGGGATTKISYRFQRYDANGAAAGAEVRISGDVNKSGFPSNDAITCDVVGLADGTFLTTWTATDGDNSGLSVRAQRWSAAGVYMGPTVLVNQTTANHQQKVAAASLSDGGYVLAWESTSQDGGGQGIYARRYNAAGAAVSAEFLVNTYTAGNQSDVAIAGLNDGGFYVTWHSDNGTGTGVDIYGQRYDVAGAKIGGETRVNLDTVNSQAFSAITAREDGGVVAAWVSSDVHQNGGHEIISRIIPNGVGGSGDDELVCGVGNDLLLGRGGADTLTGGDGADAFRYLSPGDGADVITDFQTGEDQIQLSSAGFGGMPTGQLTAAAFALASDVVAGTRVIFDPTTKVLSYDADGSGAGASATLATLNGVTTLNHTAIYIVA